MRDLFPPNHQRHHCRSSSDRHNHRSFCRCRSQISIKGKGRGRAAKGSIGRTMGCAEFQNRLLPRVLLYGFPHQSPPHTRSGAESERNTTSRAHVFRLGVAYLRDIGAGDELQGGDLSALVLAVSLLNYSFFALDGYENRGSPFRCPRRRPPLVSHVPSLRCLESCRRGDGCAGPRLLKPPPRLQTPERRSRGRTRRACCEGTKFLGAGRSLR